MAAMNFEELDDRPLGGTVTAVVNWSGAVLSILLIAGLATWGWKLLQRDVTGVPVVRALEGPMRVAPENPGGLASEYQGLAVNRIAEERTDPMAERVVLAPEPMKPDETEDLAMAALEPAIAAEEPELIAPAPDFVSAVRDEPADDEGIVAATVEANEEKPVPSATDLAVAMALGEVLEPAPVTLASSRGLAAIAPPPARPSNVRLASLSATAAPQVPAGAGLVQLGAFPTAEVAKAEWDRIGELYGELMTGKNRVVQQATSGGRTFFRLRAAGFEDVADARRFCTVLVAEGANCIAVVQN